ncbi:type 1 glutamine amidotransferase domain-containing protein [Anabaena azotica]|uniref:Type 1 glutamine amidotransferase domain-containing protein n=1 Tax=Anabaena azotica FACHB-119 TaxID=947527 RepID=A0ABR8D2V3_9NOST|nr:type 1 glutamine amidotransferase domain-containing protein [Anabaena azotica]MBD2500647.1 type 1 glutamine amidotransferase domain-containing protein [Anabaena azotica FACHB-119]
MKDKKVLIVITSHNTLNNGKETGYWLGEVTHFYHILAEAGFAIDFTSPKGSQPPLDQRSYDLRDKDNRLFWEDENLQAQLNNTIPIEAVNPEDYIAIYYAGGHGAMWDFPNNERLAQVAAQIYENGGFISAVCHGSAGLLNIKLADGRYLLDGKTVTGFANLEEKLIRLVEAVPYLLEDELKKQGAIYKRGIVPFIPHIEVSDRLITGQNPQSAKAVAKALVNSLS